MSSLSLPLRRLISGPKARFVQDGVDLDLVYVTDRLIIMAFPASGVATLWRNDRRAVRKFLDERHGDKWRVYNFCPKSENDYDGEDFYGRVSRYPFPDHHPPPLSLIPMVVADMTAWFADDPENVVVIHCKAGKGRSGTLACCYLMSLPKLPPPPQDPRNLGLKPSKKAPPSSASTAASSLVATPVTSDEGKHADLGASSHGLPRKPSGLVLKAKRSISALRSRKSSAALQREAGQEPPSRETSPSMTRRSSLAFLRPSSRRFDTSQAPPLPSSVASSRTPSVSTSAPQVDPSLVSSTELASMEDKLEAVFDLHTSRRMKGQKASAKKQAASSSVDNVNASRLSADVSRKASASTPALLKVPSPSAAMPPPQLPPMPHMTPRRASSSALFPRTIDAPISGGADTLQTSTTTTTTQGRLSFAEPSTPRQRSSHSNNASQDSTFTSPLRNNASAANRMRASSAASLASMAATPSPRVKRAALGATPMGRSCEALGSAGTPNGYTTPTTRPVDAAIPSLNVSPSSSTRSKRSATAGHAADTSIASSTGPRNSLSVFDASSGGRPSQEVSPTHSASSSYSWGRKSLDFFRKSTSAPQDQRRTASTASGASAMSGVSSAMTSRTSVDRWQGNGSTDTAASGGAASASVEGPMAKNRKYGVSIASQRRWVGYWARMLNKEDSRASMDPTKAGNKPRMIRLLRISVLQDAPSQQQETGEAAGPHKTRSSRANLKSITKMDAYHVTLGRYHDKLVEKLESWERGARRRDRVFGACGDPSQRAPDVYSSKRSSPESEHARGASEEGTQFPFATGSGTGNGSGLNTPTANLHRPASCVPGEDRWLDKYGHEHRGDSTSHLPLSPSRSPSSPTSPVRGETAYHLFTRRSMGSRRPSTADWQRCSELNTHEGAKKRLAQHGNEEGVGEWGVNVLAEAERVRHFNWPDDGTPPEKEGGKGEAKKGEAKKGEGEREKDKGRFKFLNWFARLEAKVEPEELGQPVSTDSASNDSGIWHHFRPSDAVHQNFPISSTSNGSSTTPTTNSEGLLIPSNRELCIKIHLANRALRLLPDIAGAAGWAWIVPAFEEPVKPQRKEKRRPTGSEGTNGQAVSGLVRPGDGAEEEQEEVVDVDEDGSFNTALDHGEDADANVAGPQSPSKGRRSGDGRKSASAAAPSLPPTPAKASVNKHSKEATTSSSQGSQGQRRVTTVVRLERDDIDFVKRVTGLKAIEVEWEVVRGEEDEDSDDEEHDGDAEGQ